MNTSEIKQKINALAGLPAFPPAALKALTIPNDAPGSMRELATLISFDPMLLAAISGSAQDCEMDEEKIESALMDDGVGRVRKKLLRFSFPRLFPADIEYVEHSLATAELAERIAVLVRSRLVDEAFAAGLFHDIGKPILARLAPEDFAAANEAVRTEDIFVLDAERLEVGVDHALAGKWLAERWGLPAEYVMAVWLHHHPPHTLERMDFPLELIFIVALADELAHAQKDKRTGTPVQSKRCAELLAHLRITTEMLEGILDSPAPDEIAVAGIDCNSEIVAIPKTRGQAARLRKEAHRYQVLLFCQRQLISASDADTVLDALATGLKEGFQLESALFYFHSEEMAHLVARAWPSRHGPCEAFHWTLENKASASASDLLFPLFEKTFSNMADARLPIWHPLLGHVIQTVPLAADGAPFGQVLYRIGTHGVRLALAEAEELEAFIEGAARALQQCIALHRLQSEAENLAAALWRQDMTHGKQLRAEAMRTAAQLAAGAAHEINNPLAVILGRAEILLGRAYAPDDAKALQTIVQQSRRIGNLLSDLLQFAQPAEPRTEPTVISYLLHQVTALARGRLESKGITIVEDYTQGLPRVRVDRQQAEHLFVHLIANAESAMSRGGGVLTLRVYPVADRKAVGIEFVDTGQGIAPDDLSKVFEPFYSRNAQDIGAGLGLPVCQSIVQSHHGTISLRSQPRGGTICTVTFPTLAEAPASTPQALAGGPATPAQVHKPAPGRPSVLIIDDETDLREVLTESLASRGFAAYSARDELETMAMIIGHRIDVAIMDIHMDANKGMVLLRLIRERYPRLPLVALSSVTDDDDADEASRLGAVATIRKPFELKALLHEMDQLLANRNVA